MVLLHQVSQYLLLGAIHKLTCYQPSDRGSNTSHHFLFPSYAISLHDSNTQAPTNPPRPIRYSLIPSMRDMFPLSPAMGRHDLQLEQWTHNRSICRGRSSLRRLHNRSTLAQRRRDYSPTNYQTTQHRLRRRIHLTYLRGHGRDALHPTTLVPGGERH